VPSEEIRSRAVSLIIREQSERLTMKAIIRLAIVPFLPDPRADFDPQFGRDSYETGIE
jgi:hypothetical protein